MPGDQKALAEAMAEVEADVDDADEQRDLLGLPENRKVIALRAKRPAKDGTNRGRNPGAPNKRTLEMAQYLRKRYGSPLEILAQMSAARVDELSVQLGCSKLEAWQEKRLAAIARLPYEEQKQPVAIDVTKRSVVYLKIDEGGDFGGDDAGDSVTARVVAMIEGEAKDITPQ